MGYCLRSPAVKNNLYKKNLIDHENPQGMQAFAFNTRKDLFKDRRVRKLCHTLLILNGLIKTYFMMLIKEQIVFLKILN